MGGGGRIDCMSNDDDKKNGQLSDESILAIKTDSQEIQPPPQYSFGSITKVSNSEVIGIVSTLLIPSISYGACAACS